MRIIFDSGVSFELPTPETHPGDFARWSVDHAGTAHPDSALGSKGRGGGMRCPCGPVRVFDEASYRDQQRVVVGGEPMLVVHRERYASLDGELVMLLHVEPAYPEPA